MSSKSLKIFLIILALTVNYVNADCKKDETKQEPKKIVRRFFTLVHRKKYEKAYGHFSRSVKREMSLSRFKTGAQDVRYLKILKIQILDCEENLMKLKIRAFMHLVYKDRLFEAIYEGKVNLYRERNNWTILKVNLKAVKQRNLKKKAPKDKPQKLEFGS